MSGDENDRHADKPGRTSDRQDSPGPLFPDGVVPSPPAPSPAPPSSLPQLEEIEDLLLGVREDLDRLLKTAPVLNQAPALITALKALGRNLNDLPDQVFVRKSEYVDEMEWKLGGSLGKHRMLFESYLENLVQATRDETARRSSQRAVERRWYVWGGTLVALALLASVSGYVGFGLAHADNGRDFAARVQGVSGRWICAETEAFVVVDQPEASYCLIEIAAP